ncbi:MAG: hypothetical protein ACLPKI_22265 [Streptosporangiaceae bacterium]
MDQPGARATETFNPWTVVNLVFHHLAEHGLHPVLGESGDPGRPAADLLLALGVEPAAEGNQRFADDVRNHLADLRDAFFGDG